CNDCLVVPLAVLRAGFPRARSLSPSLLFTRALMVGMDLEQTGTRSRPLSTPASDRGIRQRSASDRGIRQRYVQVRLDPCRMDGWQSS
ncbi:unnamed protein product, partial [Staurois parvus]